ncbi:hypothetical protein B0H13DRAFT_1909374 [Mycena leptocephala]|nr:hypothetical protein B0H13DRAFT_1909374 [Mycena leptocephala]
MATATRGPASRAEILRKGENGECVEKSRRSGTANAARKLDIRHSKVTHFGPAAIWPSDRALLAKRALNRPHSEITNHFGLERGRAASPGLDALAIVTGGVFFICARTIDQAIDKTRIHQVSSRIIPSYGVGNPAMSPSDYETHHFVNVVPPSPQFPALPGTAVSARGSRAALTAFSPTIKMRATGFLFFVRPQAVNRVRKWARDNAQGERTRYELIPKHYCTNQHQTSSAAQQM